MQATSRPPIPTPLNESFGHDLLRFGPGTAQDVLKDVTFVGSETPFPAVARTVGFGLEKSKILYLSRRVD
jgi:hypothetical protein